MKAALEYLRAQEYEVGNGQCPSCSGVSERWAGDFRHPRIEHTGHEKGCKLAAAIESVGGKVRYAKPSTAKERNAILRRQDPEGYATMTKIMDSAVREMGAAMCAALAEKSP